MKKTPRRSAPESCIQRGTGTLEVDVAEAPRTHAFLIQTSGGYKIINGQIDTAPKTSEVKETFEVAKNKLTEAILNLTKASGQSTISKKIRQLVTAPPTTQPQKLQAKQQG